MTLLIVQAFLSQVLSSTDLIQKKFLHPAVTSNGTWKHNKEDEYWQVTDLLPPFINKTGCES